LLSVRFHRDFYEVSKEISKGESMNEQQSQKRGVRSEAQKEMRAREGYAPLPPSNAVGGASGENKRDTPTDEDLSLSLDEKNARQRRKDQVSK